MPSLPVHADVLVVLVSACTTTHGRGSTFTEKTHARVRPPARHRARSSCAWCQPSVRLEQSETLDLPLDPATSCGVPRLLRSCDLLGGGPLYPLAFVLFAVVLPRIFPWFNVCHRCFLPECVS